VYDKQFFNVTGRIWGLRLEEVEPRIYQTEALNSEKYVGVGKNSAAGLKLKEPPQKCFPAGKNEGILPGVTAGFSLRTDGIGGNSEVLKRLYNNTWADDKERGLNVTPKVYFAPYDDMTGRIKRLEAVEAELWYDTGPYSGNTGLARYEPKTEYFGSVDDFSGAGEGKIGMKLFIPAGIRVAAKGSMNNLPQTLGLNSGSDKWLKNGVVIIAFKAELTFTVGDRTVTIGYDCGPADMWELEGWNETEEFLKGDVLFFDADADIRDAFFTDHLN